MDEEKQGYLSVGELSGELNVKPSWVYWSDPDERPKQDSAFEGRQVLPLFTP